MLSYRTRKKYATHITVAKIIGGALLAITGMAVGIAVTVLTVVVLTNTPIG